MRKHYLSDGQSQQDENDCEGQIFIEGWLIRMHGLVVKFKGPGLKELLLIEHIESLSI